MNVLSEANKKFEFERVVKGSVVSLAVMKAVAQLKPKAKMASLL